MQISRGLLKLGLALLCLFSAVGTMAQGGHGSQHYLFYLNNAGTLHLYQAYCSNCYAFTLEDITNDSGAPPPYLLGNNDGGLTAYSDSNDVEYIYYVSSSNHVVQIT